MLDAAAAAAAGSSGTTTSGETCFRVALASAHTHTHKMRSRVSRNRVGDLYSNSESGFCLSFSYSYPLWVYIV